MDNVCEGQSRTARTPALVQKMENKINEDCHQTLWDVTSSVGVSHISVCKILKHDLHMNKMLQHIVPRVLMEQQEETYV